MNLFYRKEEKIIDLEYIYFKDNGDKNYFNGEYGNAYIGTIRSFGA